MLLRYAISEAMSSAVMLAKRGHGMGGRTGLPSLRTPERSARSISTLVQVPSPVSGSGVRLLA